MKLLLIIASALLLTACFSEDMKTGSANATQGATVVSMSAASNSNIIVIESQVI